MSTKTMKQRIASVAVAALTAGVISVVAAPSASANVSAGELSFVTQGNVYNSGACVITNSNTANATVATFRTGSTVALIGDGLTANDDIYVALSGPGVISAWASAPANELVLPTALTQNAADSMTATELLDTTTAANDRLIVTLTGVGTVTLSVGVSSSTAVLDVITITSVAACSGGTFSSTFSDISTTSSSTDATWTANVDEQTSVEAGGSLYIRVDADNAYDANITTGTFAASATNGALVNYGTTIGTAVGVAGSTSFQSSSDVDGSFVFRVDPASAADGGTTTVTVTLGGTTIATKSLTFFGEAKSIKVGTVRSGVRSGTVSAETATGYFTFQFIDAAGRAVPGNGIAHVAATATTTITTGATVKAPSASAAVITDAGTGLVDAVETAIGSTTDGVAAFSCGSSSGTSTATFAHVNAITGATITVNQALTCAGGIATYTVSTDKASYNVGEIATITIDAKDSSGFAVADSTVMEAGSVSVGGGSLTRTIAGTDTFTGGKRTLQAQLTTAGSFNTVVGLTGSVTTSATTGYKVADGAVSNAAILQSIVALIASINKQIQALQKLILARR